MHKYKAHEPGGRVVEFSKSRCVARSHATNTARGVCSTAARLEAMRCTLHGRKCTRCATSVAQTGRTREGWGAGNPGDSGGDTGGGGGGDGGVGDGGVGDGRVGDGGSSDGRGGGGKVVGLTLSADVPVEARAHEQPVCEYVQRRAGQMRPSGVTLYYRARRVEDTCALREQSGRFACSAPQHDDA